MTQGELPDWRPLSSVEGLPLLGGVAQVRVRLASEHGLLLEIIYPAGVHSPVHSHQHDSFIYLLSGHLVGTINGDPAELRPQQTIRHPIGVPHTVRAVTNSHWLEFKSPPQNVVP